jgi:LacI family purine nucleotide synthesis repressor
VPKGKLSKELKYHRIFNEIRQEILSGQLLPSTQLLGFRELMEHYSASYSTIAKTLKELEAARLITRRQGKGIFVAPKSAWEVEGADSSFIGLIVTDMHIPFFNRIIHTVESEVTSARYHLVVRNSDFDSARERQIVQEFIAQRFKGILLVPTFDEADTEYLKGVDGKTIPLVYINRHKWSYECNYVVPDDYAGAAEVMHYLFENGHRRIGYFAGKRIRGRDLRYRAYEDCLKLAGLEVVSEWIVHGEHFEIESGYWCMNELLKLTKLPTAIFCYSDNMAAGAMRACQEKGIRVPEDMSFVGCNDDEICRVIRPNLTTLANPIESISSLVVRTLFDLIRAVPGEKAPVQLKVPMRLIPRETIRQIR